MSNEVKLFNHEEFGAIRAINVNGDVLFVMNDVCKSFGATNPYRLLENLDDDEKGYTQIETPGGVQSMAVVNEAGLYSVLFALQPNKAKARGVSAEEIEARIAKLKAFKRWVTHEVLPSIHRTGGYMVARADETPLETVSRALLIVKEALDRKSEQADRLAEENAAMAPKALFADVVANSEGLILMRDLAHMLRQNGIDIGERRLFQWMRDNGFLEKNRNEPTQKSLDMGLMRVVVGSYVGSDGRNMMTRTAKITGKGQQYFVNRFLAQKEAVA